MPKAAKKRAKRSMPKMKSDIEYSSIFNTKDNTTTSSSSGGNSKSKLFRLWLTCKTKFIVN